MFFPKNVAKHVGFLPRFKNCLWAAGAGPFYWVDSSNFSTVLSTKDTLKVYPQTTTTYAVYNLVDTLYIQIVVNPLPTISAAYDSPSRNVTVIFKASSIT